MHGVHGSNRSWISFHDLGKSLSRFERQQYSVYPQNPLILAELLRKYEADLHICWNYCIRIPRLS
jgi:hypothetical protein